MMYCKALFFHDPASGALIMASKDPAGQKTMGRKIKGWDKYLWRQVCERVAFEGNWWKYYGNETWRDVLMGTGDRQICEASKVDRIWGIGHDAEEAMEFRDNWGENLLGKALMRVRRCLKERIKEFMEGNRVKGDWDLPGEKIGAVREGEVWYETRNFFL
jgi:ribA/ribD-fused uncharacterized protein